MTYTYRTLIKENRRIVLADDEDGEWSHAYEFVDSKLRRKTKDPAEVMRWLDEES